MLKKPPLKIDDLILFILSNSNPNMGIKKLNKLAFLLEFTYLFEHETPLTGANYAALQMGPVIDDYKDLMKRKVKDKRIFDVVKRKFNFLKSQGLRYPSLNAKHL